MIRVPLSVYVGDEWSMTLAETRVPTPFSLITFAHTDGREVRVRFDSGKCVFLDEPPTPVSDESRLRMFDVLSVEIQVAHAVATLQRLRPELLR